MSYYVLVYNRQLGQLVRGPESFPDESRRDALRRRFELEKAYPGLEVVVLGGESEAAIRRTHGRYFKSISELLATGSGG